MNWFYNQSAFYSARMEPWIFYTLLAVVMQSVRTAGQKQVTQYLSVPAATLVRFLFGVPFTGIYWGYLYISADAGPILVPDEFFFWCLLAAVSQIIATVFLVKALQMRNFAVSISLAKTETLMTAVIGSWFFHETLGVSGYVSVVLGVAGVLIASKWQIGVRDHEANSSIVYSLGAGLGFALASLWLREGMLSLAVPAPVSAAYALLFMVFIQTVFCSIWVVAREPEQLRIMRKRWAPCLFIGFTSVAGSVGWFTAISLQNAALVRTLGQTEFLLALAITHFYFGEAISRREYAGILLVMASVILLIGASWLPVLTPAPHPPA